MSTIKHCNNGTYIGFRQLSGYVFWGLDFRWYLAYETRARMPRSPRINPAWEGLDHPIVNLTWDKASAYCQWAGGRLPTEAEWEYAARGGKQGLTYPWGDEISPENAKYASNDGTTPVGSYPSNGFGLYDMVGNVWEWCGDWYDKSYYSNVPEKDPQGPRRSVNQRVIRGGAWVNGHWCLRASVRGGSRPGSGSSVVGFRCCPLTPFLPWGESPSEIIS